MILITGASGYIGSRLVKKLVRDGHRVRAMVIRNDPFLPNLKGIDCEIVIGDITDKDTIAPCLKGVDTVFHLAAVLVSRKQEAFHNINFKGTENVVNAAVDAGIKHFIFMSAAAVAYKKRTSYGRSKAASEFLMVQRGITNFTIIRPTILYGLGGSQELKIYVENIRNSPFFFFIPGCGKARKQPVCITDVVNGLSLLVENKVAYGKIYDFSGATNITMLEFTKLLCKTFGIKKMIMPTPTWLCYFAVTVINLFYKNTALNKDAILGVTMDADFSFEQAKNEIGYNPVSLSIGFKQAFAREEDRF